MKHPLAPYLATTFSTALGPFSVAATSDGALVGAAFGDVDALAARLPTYATLAVAAGAPPLREAELALTSYLAGCIQELDVPLAPIGSEFQLRVWAALRRIERGVTRTYGELARELGTSPRAVGRANATNPVCVVIPCHRVTGAGGALTGFAFGLEKKAQLLALEAGDSRSGGSIPVRVHGSLPV
jgi:methylated-DNA-[protein]-cysteine S-methyltransferase